MQCYFCGKEVEVLDRVGRQDRCPHCYGDLHICRNCTYYDPKAYNECRETQAERVVDKEASNFCDYFAPTQGATTGAPTVDPVAEAKRKLVDLFKKKL